MLIRILLGALLVALPGGAQATPRSVSVSYNVLLKMLVVEHDGARYEQIITRLDLKP